LSEASWKTDLQKTTDLLAAASGQAARATAERVELPIAGLDVEACYFAALDAATGQIVAGFATTDRWLSQSIEADLMFRRDDLEELLAEELADQGYNQPLKVEHFRDEAKRYVFLSRLPEQEWAQLQQSIVSVVKAYTACFAELGDLRGE
jgi:hypothetical protein